MEETNGSCLDLSNSTDGELSGLIRNGFDSLVYLVLLPLTSVIGIILNVSFMYVVWKVIEMRTNLNALLINLSIADVLFLSTSFPWKFLTSIRSPLDMGFDHHILGIYGCRLVILSNDLFSFASLFFVTFIAVERYYAVCRPLKHLYLVGKRRMTTLSLSIWMVAILFAVVLLPAHWHFKVTCIVWPDRKGGFPPVVGRCSTVSESYDTVSFALMTLPFVFALFLNLFIYLSILLKLHQRKHFRISDESSCRRQMTTASRMLMINGLVFFVCNSPFNILATCFFIIHAYGVPPPTFAGLNAIATFCRYLFYLNSAINPLIYGATNHRYRASFRTSFRCRKPFTPERLYSRAIVTSTRENNRMLVVNFNP